MKLMVTMIDEDGTLEPQLPEGLQAGDVLEMECMAQVASITQTIEQLPDRLILHLYDVKLDLNENWQPPVPEEPAPIPPGAP